MTLRLLKRWKKPGGEPCSLPLESDEQAEGRCLDGEGLLQFMQQQQGYSDPAQAIAEASVRAILAGNDIVECPIEPDRLATVVAALTTAVQSGRISPERLCQSLRRILALKVRMGLISLP